MPCHNRRRTVALQRALLSACLLFVLILLLSSCCSRYLSVHSDYLSHRNLASYHVDTPDPLKACPPIGQRVLISWSLPKQWRLGRASRDIFLDITLRFGNREECHFKWPIAKRKGTYLFSLLDDDYLEKEGISTYKVDLVDGSFVLESWRHQLWKELISFSSQDAVAPESIAPVCPHSSDLSLLLQELAEEEEAF